VTQQRNNTKVSSRLISGATTLIGHGQSHGRCDDTENTEQERERRGFGFHNLSQQKCENHGDGRRHRVTQKHFEVFPLLRILNLVTVVEGLDSHRAHCDVEHTHHSDQEQCTIRHFHVLTCSRGQV